MQDETLNRRKRVLSGIQPSGRLHLGNWAGAVRQFVELQDTHEMFIFVASYHALTSVRDAEALRSNVRQVVIDYIAFGLDPDKASLYVQQDVPMVCELAWVLGCVCPVSMMDKAVSYKDKVAKGLSPSIGLYTYPILQSADILGVDPDIVPVGEDQRQHVEITRDLAARFNAAYGEVFKLPEVMVRSGGALLPGLDGQKMSKSYGNTIDPFEDEKALRKRVMRIVTDSKPPEEAKEPAGNTIYQLFEALAGAGDERTLKLADRYRSSGTHGMGYGEAKQALFELIMETFAESRQRRERLMADVGLIDEVLQRGAASANEAMSNVVARVRRAVGL